MLELNKTGRLEDEGGDGNIMTRQHTQRSDEDEHETQVQSKQMT